MDQISPLKSLKLKWWHAILISTSFFTFILSLTVKFVIFSNEDVALTSLAIFFISLGEFANQSFQEGIVRDSFGNIKGTVSKDIRVPTVAGKVLWSVGLIIVFYEIFTVFNTL